MEWDKQHSLQQPQSPTAQELTGAANSGGMFVKVMTDEQMEVLRNQIAAYATICEQLVDLHKSIASHHDFAGIRLGNLYCDPLVTSAGHKITGRQRWSPSQAQLQILEHNFEQGNGAPSKQKIKEITAELAEHGQISETNVYNWFQNRRARSKRKQQAATSTNVDSEVDTEVESPNEKKTKPKDLQSTHIPTSRTGDHCYQNADASSGMFSIELQSSKAEPIFPSEGSSKPAGIFGQGPFCETLLSNPRMDHLLGKMEMSESYMPFLQAEDYNMSG